jgi:hypothetical protein
LGENIFSNFFETLPRSLEKKLEKKLKDRGWLLYTILMIELHGTFKKYGNHPTLEKKG